MAVQQAFYNTLYHIKDTEQQVLFNSVLYHIKDTAQRCLKIYDKILSAPLEGITHTTHHILMFKTVNKGAGFYRISNRLCCVDMRQVKLKIYFLSPFWF